MSFGFDLIHGSENSSSVIEHVAANAGPEVLALYKLALEDPKACGVVRAKSPVDGTLVGTVIICRSGTSLATWIPVLNGGAGETVGGIVAPVVLKSAQSEIVLQGLALLGIRQNKAHRGKLIFVLSLCSGMNADV